MIKVLHDSLVWSFLGEGKGFLTEFKKKKEKATQLV